MNNKVRLFEPELIFCGIEVKDKVECLERMVSYLAENGILQDKKAFLDVVLEREAIMSTGIGRNIALPHGRSYLVSTVRSVVFLLKEGIDFQAVDEQSVRFIVLTASPEKESHIYMLMLKRLTEHLRQSQNREHLFAITDKQELIKIMKGIENEVNKDLADM
ncbi:MAG: PTS sugar transporter subunit IIA [Candidatus Cloacimonetes bacterium]|nr:PTS sugar transporter subunit IIA [Candidatus Cloacimonadota bacterium]